MDVIWFSEFLMIPRVLFACVLLTFSDLAVLMKLFLENQDKERDPGGNNQSRQPHVWCHLQMLQRGWSRKDLWFTGSRQWCLCSSWMCHSCWQGWAGTKYSAGSLMVPPTGRLGWPQRPCDPACCATPQATGVPPTLSCNVEVRWLYLPWQHTFLATEVEQYGLVHTHRKLK